MICAHYDIFQKHNFLNLMRLSASIIQRYHQVSNGSYIDEFNEKNIKIIKHGKKSLLDLPRQQ